MIIFVFDHELERRCILIIYYKPNKLYGIDYHTYVCGGIGCAKLMPLGEVRELFYTESEMFKRLSELKSNNCFDRFELFTTNIVKEKYEF